MIRFKSRRLDRYRKAAISTFVLLHFSALILWIIPPYSEMIANSPLAGSPVGQFEQQVSHTVGDGWAGSILVRNYVDLIGLHQYWDFFAPDSPRIHRYLSVCTDILESSKKIEIECIDPVYQSFDGDVDRAAAPHHGKRSRSFRLVENLFRLHRPELMDAFALYWRRQKHPDETGKAFLLLHEFTLRPGNRNSAPPRGRRDEVIWIAPD